MTRPGLAGTVRVGISGWRYPPWRGRFYPPGLRQADELRYVAERMDSVEINGSFYSLLRPEHYVRWAAETPPGFVFAVKGGRFITHMKKLRDVETPLANFLASGPLALGAKLGPLLWQLPPTLGFDARRMDDFLAMLPASTAAASARAAQHDQRVEGRAWTTTDADRPLRHAVEVRHASFVTPSFLEILRRYQVALVVADTARRFPAMDDVTTNLVYVRLHGDEELYVSGYDDDALARWAARIEAWRRAGDVFVYFDNDVKVRAPTDAITLRRMLGLPFGDEALPRGRRAGLLDRRPVRGSRAGRVDEKEMR